MDDDVRVAILTGREKGRRGTACLMGLADGSIDILVGTHAIFQEKVAYKNLGLAVIDEQHRFGVSQRLLLGVQGRASAASAGDDRDPDPAHADAHPIWRDGRQPIDEMPPGRTPVETRVISEEKLPDVVDGAWPPHRGGRPGLLGLPAGRGEREERRGGRRGARADPQAALRRGQGRPGPWPHERPGEGCGDGALRFAETSRARRDDRDRGRRRRAQCDADDRRGRRALRARPAPPVARPGRARVGQEHLPADPRRIP